jgi:hypothetical protein
MNGSEQSEAKRQSGLTQSLFLVLTPPDTQFKQKFTETYAIIDNFLQKVTRVCSLVQYPTDFNTWHGHKQ